MKATLQYDLPEDQEELKDALNAHRYTTALWNIKQEVRRIWKYEELPEEAYAVVDKIYEYICHEISESDLDM